MPQIKKESVRNSGSQNSEIKLKNEIPDVAFQDVFVVVTGLDDTIRNPEKMRSPQVEVENIDQD